MAVPYITKDNASALGRKGAIATAERWKLARKLTQLVPAPAAPEVTPLDGYVGKRLMRVRKQLERLSDMLDDETDPAKIDRLASAIDRLAKHEHYLAGRPGPGNRKPAPERQAKRNFTPTPQPVVPVQARVNDPNEPNG